MKLFKGDKDYKDEVAENNNVPEADYTSPVTNAVLPEMFADAMFPYTTIVNTEPRCLTCQRGDIWQEAVSRTRHVFNGEAVENGQEVIDYLLAEVASISERE